MRSWLTLLFQNQSQCPWLGTRSSPRSHICERHFGARTQKLKKRERNMHLKRMFMMLLSLCLVAATLGTATAAQEKAKIKGMIKTRTGETLVVKTADGNATTVVLTDDTNTKDDKGLFGLDKQIMSNSVLIPGLKVKVDGTTDDQGRVLAKTITVDGDDLETAEMIQAGLHPTAEQVAANIQAIESNRQGVAANKVQLAAQKESIDTNAQNISANRQQIEANIKDIEENTQRFSALADFDVKNQATVNFNVGSSSLDAKDKEALKQL